MRKSSIYVLHVGTGQEKRVLEQIERMVPRELYDELFSPQFEKTIKQGGSWRMVKAPLLPGYMFITTEEVDPLRQALLKVPAFTKLLGLGSDIVALDNEEVIWLDKLTKPFERVVGYSKGFIEGDRVVIIDGPLIGHESEIVKIDRHKRFAYLAFQFMGRDKEIKVGLEILSKVAGSQEEEQ